TIVGSSLVVAGGSSGVAPYFLDSVEVAPIEPGGSLGTFQEVGHLVTARESHSAAVIGDALYVLGGDATAGGVPALASIERAPILGDGSLGTFASAGQLAVPRDSAALWQLGSRVFVAGGQGNTFASASVEVASIGTNGALGSFTVSTS